MSDLAVVVQEAAWLRAIVAGLPVAEVLVLVVWRVPEVQLVLTGALAQVRRVGGIQAELGLVRVRREVWVVPEIPELQMEVVAAPVALEPVAVLLAQLPLVQVAQEAPPGPVTRVSVAPEGPGAPVPLPEQVAGVEIPGEPRWEAVAPALAAQLLREVEAMVREAAGVR